MQRPQALVTEAEGFIGRHWVPELRAHGWQVQSLAHADGTGMDLRDGDAVVEAIASAQPDVIFHLAGVSGPIVALIAVDDVAKCLRNLAEAENPPENCELAPQKLTEQSLAHRVAEAMQVDGHNVLAGEQKAPGLPGWRRVIYPQLLLQDEVELLPEALQRII